MRSLKRTHHRLRASLPLRPSSTPRILPPATQTTAAITTSSTSQDTAVSPITSLLIANRGEIALRIARTASRMGIATTTLYTPVDAASQHARSSPSSLALPSYLDGEAIISLARRHGIQALHPGYGFLSENAAFARRCSEEGIVFVGPPPQAMADMGDKARSKEIMTAAGVPCVPGYHGGEQGVEELGARAREVGFPVLLKSVKGGGGKGMRIVRSEDEFEAQLRSARQEARASFGEGGEVMLVEKYIVRPRHVEVQVFADRYGNCVALGERDCSVQRRHQKILEESPAPLLDDETRHDLWDKARTAALAVGYVGAGTVEFILDRDSGKFYFMEMNTRLQVEHPVSEMVTGTDLVEWQFRVAAGEMLPMTQDEIEERIRERGAAIEARIYAENPEKGFFPDSALKEYEVVGLSTNIEFLKKLCRSKAFIEGDVETGFIEKWRSELFQPRHTEDEIFVQAALALLGKEAGGVSEKRDTLHGATLGFGEATTLGERRFAFRVRDDAAEEEGDVVEVSLTQKSQSLFDAKVSRRGANPQVLENIVSETKTPSTTRTTLTTFYPATRIESTVIQDPAYNEKVTIFQHGAKTELDLLSPAWLEKALGLKEAASSVVAPMPCKILKNEVSEGQEVEKGAPLVV
jgi:3-methylcrotonyl-CoA carboxylase alpha subunit